jgi:hypothetical protein
MPATGIAEMLAAPGSCARPLRAVPPGSVAELSCQKIIFDLQLADLPVQKIDLRFIGGSLPDAPPSKTLTAPIAAWAAMEIMTAEFYKRQNWKGLWAHNVFPISREGDIVEMMDNGLPRPNTQTTTFVVGELYIHAFSSALKEMVNMIRIGPNTRGESTFAQIWPRNDSVIVWPANPMTDRDADTVASAFLTFAQKVGPARRS